MSLSPVTMTTSKPALFGLMRRGCRSNRPLHSRLAGRQECQGIHHAVDVGNLGAHAVRHGGRCAL